MVNFSPDPDHPTEDLTPSNDLIITTDTDTDDELETPYNDYEPLPTQETEEPISENSDNNDTLPEIVPIENELVQEVWSDSTSRSVDIPMDTAKVDLVKQAMLNFTLPASSIPEWATQIPDEQLQETLISRIQSLQQK